jgi:hypothetical protein
VDKFKLVTNRGQEQHAEGTAHKLVVARCDCAIDLEVAEHAFDPVALAVETRAVERIVLVQFDFGGIAGLVYQLFRSLRIASAS